MAVTPSTQTDTLPVVRAADIQQQPAHQRWLVRDLWSHLAVGIVGGQPKSAKTWFGLDLAVSVASGTDCLGRFPVECPGTALAYLAEDSLVETRARIEALCLSRNLDIQDLDLSLIAAPTVRIDILDHQRRLEATIKALNPRLLLLDPLVRLHRLDEDRASDISGILGYLREMQRTFDLAVVLVHHAGKKHRANPGQALRGSSDLHAWADSAAYLSRKNGKLSLIIEHRSAPTPGAFTLELVSRPDGSATHLEVVGEPPVSDSPQSSLTDMVMKLLEQAGAPLYRGDIRKCLKVNNQRLGQALGDLERSGAARRTPKGWEHTTNSTINHDAQDAGPTQLQLLC